MAVVLSLPISIRRVYVSPDPAATTKSLNTNKIRKMFNDGGMVLVLTVRLLFVQSSNRCEMLCSQLRASGEEPGRPSRKALKGVH